MSEFEGLEQSKDLHGTRKIIVVTIEASIRVTFE